MYTAYTAGFQNEKEQNRLKTATLSYYAKGSDDINILAHMESTFFVIMSV